jgi:hypothetical protein
MNAPARTLDPLTAVPADTLSGRHKITPLPAVMRQRYLARLQADIAAYLLIGSARELLAWERHEAT